MSDNISSLTPYEWSHPVSADEVGSAPERLEIGPDEEQAKALSKRLSIESLQNFKAKLILSRNSGNRVVHVEGTLTGIVVQNCVVSLEPINAQINETFEAWYADPDAAVSFTKERQKMLSRKQGEDLPILDEKDDPEPIVDGVIDLGEICTQFLSLAIDPYPHAEGVVYEHGDDEINAEDPSNIRKNPFEALKNWKDKV